MTKLEKQTKMKIDVAVIKLNFIISYAERQIERAKGIPILNDADHADWVRGYEERIDDIMCEMYNLDHFGEGSKVNED